MWMKPKGPASDRGAFAFVRRTLVVRSMRVKRPANKQPAFRPQGTQRTQSERLQELPGSANSWLDPLSFAFFASFAD